jgi:hypothetical protein
MSQDKHEPENHFQDDAALSKLYQHSSTEQPPTALDDAILAASRRAVKSGPRVAFSPFAAGWRKPLALAAVLVLSVSVVITLQQESAETSLMQPRSPEAEPSMEAPGRAFDGTIQADSVDAQMPSKAIEQAAEALKDMDQPTDAAIPAGRRQESGDTGRQRLLMREMPAQPALSPPAPAQVQDSINLELSASQAEATESVDALTQETGNALDTIIKLWDSGDKDEAIRQLQAFLQQHPDIAIDDLRNTLDPALLESVIPEKND